MGKIMITGVAGMIGSHLLDSLLSNGKHQVIGVDDLSFGSMKNISHNLQNPNFRFIKCNILDEKRLSEIIDKPDIIIHLAAVKKISESESSFPTLRVNVMGTENVFKIAKESNSKVIFASTSDVYGMSESIPFREDGDSLIGPSMFKRWSYAVSKLYCEQLAFGYFKEHKVPTVILRYFGGFSVRSSFLWSGGHLPIFVKKILDNEEILIHGDGSQTRSMAYVSDLVDGTILAMDNEAAIGEIINIGNDEEMSVLESAHLIHKLVGDKNELKFKFVPFKDIFGEGYKDIQRRIPDLSKARQILGYEPKISLEDAILKTIDKTKSLPSI